MAGKLLIIVCTAAGKQRAVSTQLKAVLNNYPEVSYKFVYIKIPPDLTRALKPINIQSYDAAAIYGGDGTIVSSFKYFQDYRLPLLVLPGGTANALAKYFGMPGDPTQCLELYLNNTFVVRRVDIGSVNDNPLVLDLHMGLWTKAILSTPRKLKKKIGVAAYAWSALKSASKAPLQTYEFTVDNEPKRTVLGYTFLVVNQGRHDILGQPIFLRDQEPGVVQVAIVKSVKIRDLVRWFIYKIFTHGRNLQSVVETHRAGQITISKAPKQILADDTERSITPPVVIKGSSNGVRVITPPVVVNPHLLIQLWRRLQLWWLRVWQRIRVFANLGPSIRYSHVAPGIYVGGKVGSRTINAFRGWGITGIVSMRTTKPPVTPASIETLWLPTRDWTPPSLADFKKGVEFIQKQRDNNGSVYIHCQLGEGRGPSMAAAYLITKGFTVDEAVALLTKYRPMVHPNAKQLKRLAEWQETYNTNA